MGAVQKVDSNITGLRYAQELSLGVLDPTPANQTWFELEPNTYPDFGGKVTTLSRNPINPGRQRKKGVVTNVEGSGGWNTDLTQANLQDMLQGFFFASFRKKKEFSGVQTVTGGGTNTYGATGIGTGAFVGDIMFGTGYTNAANNGVKNVTTAAANLLTVSEALVGETSPAAAKLVCVGFKFTSGDVSITNTGTAFPTMASVTKDLTTLGLIPGEWVFLGGDAAGDKFATAANNGFARVRSVATNLVTFDKTAATMVTDAGTGKTVRLFKGRCLKNEIGSTIVRRTYTLERTLGYSDDSDQTKEQAEYLTGSVPNQLTTNLKSADKINCDLTFVSQGSTSLNENVTGANTLLSKIAGVVRVPVTEADAFNTSSDFSRIRLSTVSSTNAFPTPLFTYSEDMTLVINNNIKAANALGVLGAFELSAGQFVVSGSITAYFGDVASIQAVRNNADITLDIIAVRANSGIAIDLPLIGLGGGLANITPDTPIKLPLDNNAATGAKVATTLNHTAFMVFFDYLPNLADT